MSRTGANRQEQQPTLPAHLAPIRVLSERPPRPLTREEAAEELGLHPRTIDRWAPREAAPDRPRRDRADAGG